jgi:hypothetical protein
MALASSQLVFLVTMDTACQGFGIPSVFCLPAILKFLNPSSLHAKADSGRRWDHRNVIEGVLRFLYSYGMARLGVLVTAYLERS